MLSEYQTVSDWIPVRPNILFGLIWVQTCLQRSAADDKRVGKELSFKVPILTKSS